MAWISDDLFKVVAEAVLVDVGVPGGRPPPPPLVNILRRRRADPLMRIRVDPARNATGGPLEEGRGDRIVALLGRGGRALLSPLAVEKLIL